MAQGGAQGIEAAPSNNKDLWRQAQQIALGIYMRQQKRPHILGAGTPFPGETQDEIAIRIYNQLAGRGGAGSVVVSDRREISPQEMALAREELAAKRDIADIEGASRIGAARATGGSRIDVANLNNASKERIATQLRDAKKEAAQIERDNQIFLALLTDKRDREIAAAKNQTERDAINKKFDMDSRELAVKLMTANAYIKQLESQGGK
jgi:hypothetical protein